MNKKVIFIKDCNIGDFLAKDVLNKHGAVIVPKNTRINSYIKNKLCSRENEQVCIYNHPPIKTFDKIADTFKKFELKYRNNINIYKELICELAKGQKLNSGKFNKLCDFVLNSIDESGNIIHLLQKVKAADEYTHSHCINVSFYAMLIGKWMKLSPSDMKKIVSAGLLHDIGKLFISDSILNNPEKLTPAEFHIMKQHPMYGYTFLKEIGTLNNDIIQAVLTHHEREDGSGYPFSLKSHEISIYSKIIAVADTYDAITSDRVYKKRSSPFAAFKLINHECFNSLDTTITNTFIKNLSAFYTGSKVILKCGRIGEIAFVPPNNISSPVIQIEDLFYDLSKEKELEIDCIVG
jgi:putative nucleotidyltransferase with HDIG domain